MADNDDDDTPGQGTAPQQPEAPPSPPVAAPSDDPLDTTPESSDAPPANDSRDASPASEAPSAPDATPAKANLVSTTGVGTAAALRSYTKSARAARKLANQATKQANQTAKRLNTLAKDSEEFAADLTNSHAPPTSKVGKFRQYLRQKLNIDDHHASTNAAKNLSEVEGFEKSAAAAAQKDSKAFQDLAAAAKALKDKNVAAKMAKPLEENATRLKNAADESTKLADSIKTAREAIVKDAKAIPAETKTVTGKLSTDAANLRKIATEVRDSAKDVQIAARLARGAKFLEGAGRAAGWVGLGITAVSSTVEMVGAVKTGDHRKVASAGGDIAGTIAGGAAGYGIGSMLGTGVGTVVGGAIGGVVGFFAGAGVGAVPAAAAGAAWGASVGHFLGGAAGAWYAATKGGEYGQTLAERTFNYFKPGYKPPGNPGQPPVPNVDVGAHNAGKPQPAQHRPQADTAPNVDPGPAPERIPSAPPHVPADYSLMSKDNFRDRPELAQHLENVMKLAKDADGKLYSESAEVNVPGISASEKTVRTWQAYLQHNGYPDLKIDGKMGPLTRQAGLEFAQNLEPGTGDGKAYDVAALNSIGKTLISDRRLTGPLELLTAELPTSLSLPTDTRVAGNIYSDLPSGVPDASPDTLGLPHTSAPPRSTLKTLYSGGLDPAEKKPDAVTPTNGGSFKQASVSQPRSTPTQSA